MAVIEGTTKLKSAVGEYDFAVDGGAISTIPLRASPNDLIGPIIPRGAIIVGGFVDIATALTSSGAATIAMQAEAAADILSAVAVASWTTGTKNVLPAPTSGALTAATEVKTTAARTISIVIAAFALTAGKFTVTLFYK